MVNYKLIIEYYQKGNNTQVAVRVQALFLIRWLQTERMRFMLWTAYYMYVSIDAPKFTFVRSENSHIVCMIWTTSNCTVTLNGKNI